VAQDTPRRLERSPRRLTPEYVAAHALAESATLADAVPRVLQAICQHLDWEHGALWNIDGAGGVLRCVDTWHPPTAQVRQFDAISRATAFANGVGLPGRVWATAKPAWIPDVLNDANFPRAPIANAEGLHAAFGFPILHRQAVVGVMEFFSREIREPDEEMLGMLGKVGEQIGQFMARKAADEELERFFSLSLDLLCVAGFDGYFKRVNPAWQRLLGYTQEELLSRRYLEFTHPDDRSQTTGEAGKLSGGGQVLAFENRYLAKDGSYRWLEWAATPYPDEQVIYAAARDITERKEAKETIARYSRDLKAAKAAQAEQESQFTRLVSKLEVMDLLKVVQDSLQSSGAPRPIEVLSAQPDWVELLVPCTREAAEQIHQVVERRSAGRRDRLGQLRVPRTAPECGGMGRQTGSRPPSAHCMRAHREAPDVPHRRSRPGLQLCRARSRRHLVRGSNRAHQGSRREATARRRLRAADGARPGRRTRL
jgi:PAS domain S-box-containing protein